jgi:hypothetical protein
MAIVPVTVVELAKLAHRWWKWRVRDARPVANT